MLVELRPSPKRTWCAYKGEASYWSLELDGRTYEDIAWTYERPRRECAPIAGHVAFFNERADLVLGNEYQPRAVTPWSGPDVHPVIAMRGREGRSRARATGGAFGRRPRMTESRSTCCDA